MESIVEVFEIKLGSMVESIFKLVEIEPSKTVVKRSFAEVFVKLLWSNKVSSVKISLLESVFPVDSSSL